MRKLTLSTVAFWSLAAVCVTMLVAMVLVVGGAIPIDPPSEPVQSEPQSAPQPTPTRSAAAVPVPRKPARTAAKPPAAVAKPRTRPTQVVVTAARGDSWISARVGSENGPLLDERVLAKGSSVRFRANRVWLSVGAAGHVDVTVNGKPRALAAGTVSVVLTDAAA